MRRNIRWALVGIAILGMVGFGLNLATSGQADVGKTAYVDYGCYDCHGNFDNGSGGIVDRDPGNPNAFGGIGPSIVGWGLADLKEAVYNGLYQKINYFKSQPSGAQVFTEAELSDTELADITAFLNPNFKGGNAANGETVYKETCFACHGSDALGNNLAGPPIVFKEFDVVKAVARTGILPTRQQGLMPTYNGKLDEATLKAIGDYLVSLNTR